MQNCSHSYNVAGRTGTSMASIGKGVLSGPLKTKASYIKGKLTKRKHTVVLNCMVVCYAPLRSTSVA